MNYKKVSAYIPCYNNSITLRKSIRSIKEQSHPVDEFFIIDDGSTDLSERIAIEENVRFIKNVANKGRGYTRAKAIELTNNEIVLCCDATNIIENDFLKKSLSLFNDKNVSAVYGKISSFNKCGSLNKWRSRHLFKECAHTDYSPQPTNLLITYGAVMRKSHIMSVGNFNKNLRHTEDGDLGKRLLRSNYKLIWYPSLKVQSIIDNSLSEVLERYWRWYIGKDEIMTFKDYIHAIKASIKPMAQLDLENKEWCCAIISIICPHYCLFKSVLSRIKKLKKKPANISHLT